MTRRLVTGGLLAALAAASASAGATVISTSGVAFHAFYAADQATVAYGYDGIFNPSTTQIAVIGPVIREPSTASDGSQTVTLDLKNPGGVNWSGTVWAYSSDGNVFGTQGFSVSANPSKDPVGFITKTMTFSASQLLDDSYYSAYVFLPQNAWINGAYAE